MFAPHDLVTIEVWARFHGLSQTSLRELCARAHVYPHDVHSCARLLRAVTLARGHGGVADDYLDVADARTTKRLWCRADLKTPLGRMTADQFINGQQLVTDHQIRASVLAMLRR